MKVPYSLIGFVIFLGLALYVFTSNQNIEDLLSFSQCDKPTSYKLGSLDQNFGLSGKSALTDIQDAVSIWNKAEDKQLFSFSPQAELTVNFVYDQRTALDNKINQLQSQLTQKNTTIQQQISDYKSQVSALENKLANFNSVIDQYNRQGGAPPQVYADLIKQQAQLQTEANALNEKARQLNLTTHDYNLNVQNLNQDVNQFNKAIAQKPEEGIFDGNNNTITIYFTDNHQELIHTLAHEFGHALGMEHVSDHSSIMYPYTSSTIVATSQDIQQLNFVCRKQSLPAYWFKVFENWSYFVHLFFQQQLTQTQ